MNDKKTISRDELAEKMGISTEALRKRERQLGLAICRVKMKTRPPLYIRSRAVLIIRGLGYPI